MLIASADLFRSPVAQAEHKHQSNIMENTRAGAVWVWLAYLMLYPALAVSAALYLGALLNFVIPGGFWLISGTQGAGVLGAATTHLIAMNVALYAVVTLVTMALAANSIQREKQNHTWETLLLTGVDARRIVWGKWWATVRVMWKDHALVGLLRLGMIAWLVAITHDEFMFRPGFLTLSPHMFYLLLAGFTVTAYTILDTMLTAALGQIITLLDFNTGMAVLLGFLGRVFFTAAPLAIPYLIFTTFENHEAGFYMAFWMLWLVITLVLTWGLLRLAQTLAVRQHALPPELTMTAPEPG